MAWQATGPADWVLTPVGFDRIGVLDRMQPRLRTALFNLRDHGGGPEMAVPGEPPSRCCIVIRMPRLQSTIRTPPAPRLAAVIRTPHVAAVLAALAKARAQAQSQPPEETPSAVQDG
jgi:hypothetical protein